jgi:hypothetical protein
LRRPDFVFREDAMSQTVAGHVGIIADPNLPAASTITPVKSESGFPAYRLAGLLTPAATPSDILMIAPGGAKPVRVTRVAVVITATAAGIGDVVLIRRSTLDTAGTSTTPTPVPLDVNDGSATAVVTVYTGNPTVGTSVGNVGAAKMGISAADAESSAIWEWGGRGTKSPTLRKTTDALCINMNGDTLVTGEVVSWEIEWEELPS